MHAEISALFHLQWTNDEPVKSAHIGSGVFIKRIEPEWLRDVKNQCPKIAAREQIEWHSPYTHRFYYEVDAQEAASDHLNLTTSEEKQLILRAIILSRLVKPTPIGYDSVWVKSFYHSNGTTNHYHKQVINNLNVAFLTRGAEDGNTITEADAVVMAELWNSLQFFLDDANEPKYRRIVRATKFNELAYAVYFAEISHPTFHSALESMICTSHRQNQAQVTQRLPQLISFISTQQAKEIYLTCCDFKHAAQALMQQKTSSIGALAASDQKRLDAVILLRRAIRDILIKALRDRSFADVLADPKLLRQKYKVYDRKGNLV
jgi:hypothetical protein